jgi:hypothetical protein
MESSIHTLLLGMQYALLRAVTPSLRAVSVDLDTNRKKMLFFFYYDGQVSDKLFDLASVAILEATESMPPDYLPENHILRLDTPDPLPLRGKLAFLRNEPCLPQYKKENRSSLIDALPPQTLLCLNIQEALLGKVSPALRFVAINANQNLSFYFAYDGPISDKDHTLATNAIHEAGSPFLGYIICSRIERIDAPRDFPPDAGKGVYWRWEPS